MEDVCQAVQLEHTLAMIQLVSHAQLLVLNVCHQLNVQVV